MTPSNTIVSPFDSVWKRKPQHISSTDLDWTTILCSCQAVKAYCNTIWIAGQSSNTQMHWLFSILGLFLCIFPKWIFFYYLDRGENYQIIIIIIIKTCTQSPPCLYKPEEASMVTQAHEWHWAVTSPDWNNSSMGTSIPISITNSLHTEIRFRGQ